MHSSRRGLLRLAQACGNGCTASGSSAGGVPITVTPAGGGTALYSRTPWAYPRLLLLCGNSSIGSSGSGSSGGNGYATYSFTATAAATTVGLAVWASQAVNARADAITDDLNANLCIYDCPWCGRRQVEPYRRECWTPFGCPSTCGGCCKLVQLHNKGARAAISVAKVGVNLAVGSIPFVGAAVDIVDCVGTGNPWQCGKGFFKLAGDVLMSGAASPGLESLAQALDSTADTVDYVEAMSGGDLVDMLALFLPGDAASLLDAARALADMKPNVIAERRYF